MKVLAVIPARGGSKGCPGKNLRPLGGKPLLVWSIEAATPPFTLLENAYQVPKYETRVIVSSDDQAILAVARMNGAEALERPAELATDEAATDPVIVHALDHVKAEGWRPDLVVLLQPTVPVREAGLVDRCIEKLIETGANSLLTVNRLHFVWEQVYECGGPWWRMPRGLVSRVRRQEMAERDRFWHEDGSVYVTSTEWLEMYGERVGGIVEALEIAPTVDIDTEEDFRMAAVLLRSLVIRESMTA